MLTIKHFLTVYLVWMFLMLRINLINLIEVDDSGVYISEEDEDLNDRRHRLSKRNAIINEKNVLKPIIENLQEDQEIVLSRGTGYSGGKRFKSGDVHIKKGGSTSRDSSPELTESKKLKYSYPFGIGAFLMNGCYQFTGMPGQPINNNNYYVNSNINLNNNQMNSNYDNTDMNYQSSSDQDVNYQDESVLYEKKKKKRATGVNKSRQDNTMINNRTNDLLSFCSRYAQIEPSKECFKLISGAYTLGTGFDVKYENSENSRRKSIINRYCNLQKYFRSYSVPDAMTANGIYDTKTQTMSFGESSDYMKFVASKSNLDRYTNIFFSDNVNAYGGVNGLKLFAPSTEGESNAKNQESNAATNANKLDESSDFWLFQIQSTVLIYDLILDQINPWNLDPEFLVDFLSLPESYFYPDAPEKFEAFILRYGTHVVVSAKFGGEFKIMHTMRKSKTSSIDRFAEKCNRDALKMFSRGVKAEADLSVVYGDIGGSMKHTDSKSEDKSKEKEGSESKANEYSSTYLSVKGGSQEVAAIVASMNQPDFGDAFINWLRSVSSYPKAFDFKYESLVSVLSINVASLFAYTSDKERKVCSDFAKRNCKFGFTVEDFEESWNKKLNALKFAITIYLKEPAGLTSTKFFIEKGNSDCRFNILNYMAPFWHEIIGGEQEFHITFNFNSDEMTSSYWDDSSSKRKEFFFRKNDEIYFMRRDDFWISKRKGQVYTYRSARLLGEPFSLIPNKNYINVFDLILEYNEQDATVKVADMNLIMMIYSRFTKCEFGVKTLVRNSRRSVIDNVLIKNNADTNYENDYYVEIINANLNTSDNSYCKMKHKTVTMKTRHLKNMDPFWLKLWHKVIGVVDYVDPIKAVIRTWDLKFAVLPCQLKWSNNLMMVLPRSQDEGKCLKFTAATEGELFVVIATTPSDQNTWYIFQITTKGVIFYREGSALLLNEDSAAGTTGDKGIYQNFFICFNYESRKVEAGGSIQGLYIQYGIQIDSDETSHLYLSYFDESPLDPAYYSFGSRNFDVQILNAHLEPFDVDEQIRLRCRIGSTSPNTAIRTICDYKCNVACDGCTAPYVVTACKKCAYGAVTTNYTDKLTNETIEGIVCVEKCPVGFMPDITRNNLCTDINECLFDDELTECQKNTICVNTVGSYKCVCGDGFEGNGLFCMDIDECAKNTDNCSSKAQCLNLYGSFRCACLPGFTGDGIFCHDVNECKLEIDDCSWDKECKNTIGSYECVCKNGFKYINNECVEINECLKNEDICDQKNAICKNTFGSFKCVCKNGYKMYNNTCQDINECHSTNKCDIHLHNCINTNGSYYCECKNGLKAYYTNGIYQLCSDVNECLKEGVNATCNETSSICINKHNGYMCQCKEGFYKRNDDQCYDINECHAKLHTCDSDASCVNEIGSHKCQCGHGFKMDEFNRCIDIDECSYGLHNCAPYQICLNTIGSFYCKCHVTETSNTLAKKCVENDGININCIMFNGVRICDCDRGFQLVNLNNSLVGFNSYQMCEDINECQKYESICGSNAQCLNEYGSYVCECLPGFRPNYANEKFTCDDFDECFSECSNDCDPLTAICINTIGSYECKCKDGFVGDGRKSGCHDINECSIYSIYSQCHKNAKCINTLASYECVCNRGFYGNGTYCEDINECVSLTIDDDCFKYNASCVNTFGSYECICPIGMRNASWPNGIYKYACIDIDECYENISNCPSSKSCENTLGSFVCRCHDGFEWSVRQQACLDINECLLEASICDDNSQCINTEGSFYCKCSQGWNKTNDLYCNDIDECKLGLHKCNEKASCYNTPGSYECTCNDGFYGDGLVCNDINECIDIENICQDMYLKCINTIGSYKCVCVDGFITSAEEGICIDLNECEQYHPCNDNSQCVNMLGTYDCKCLEGFEQTSATSKECFDIDECNDESKSNLCHVYSKCENTYGSYNCTCLNGFVGNGTLCQDIDECSLVSRPDEVLCNNTGKCVNTIGYYYCDCFNGFERKNESLVCSDIDECLYESCFSKHLVNNNECYAFGLCRNLLGSFICECFEGFEYDEDKGHCKDIDECQKLSDKLEITDICYDNPFFMATCVNICGNYTCECKDTAATVVDIYDREKCYARNEIRDFIFYLYVRKLSFNMFYKTINFTIEACESSEKQQKNKYSSHLELELNEFDNSLLEMTTQHWLPFYLDNTKWKSMEFICNIELSFLIISNSDFYFKDFEFVIIEDPNRRRCSIYSLDLVFKDNLESVFTSIKYKLVVVWDALDNSLNCAKSVNYLGTNTKDAKFIKVRYRA